MRFDIPTDHKKIRARIRSYERKLEKDIIEFGGMAGDGYGKRYLLIPLYLIDGDLQGALNAYDWLKNNFKENSGDCFNDFCTILLFYRTDRIKDAIKKIIDVIFENKYVIPNFLDGKPIPSSEFVYEDPELSPSTIYMPQEYINLWNNNEIEWLRNIYNNEYILQTLEKYSKREFRKSREIQNELRKYLFDKLNLN